MAWSHPLVSVLSLASFWGGGFLDRTGFGGRCFHLPSAPLQLTWAGKVLLSLTWVLGLLLFGLSGSPGSSHGGRLPGLGTPY